jgi:dihydroorotate dehydrogenase electron transfer subunit
MLELHGPLGKGFSLPENARRVALIGLAETPARLLPLANLAVNRQIAAALFTDAPLTGLPAALEIQTLAALPEALSWADFIAIDLTLQALPELRHYLGLGTVDLLPCPAQALVMTPIPCGGIAECGACAVPAHRGWKLACRDGPVFNLNELAW